MVLPAAFLLFLLPAYAAASENPDELYEQGRFAEAEKIYSQKDMDNPKDLRYRYNRGCAAYQSGDYKGALAAFTSVSKRTEQTDVTDSRRPTTWETARTSWRITLPRPNFSNRPWPWTLKVRTRNITWNWRS